MFPRRRSSALLLALGLLTAACGQAGDASSPPASGASTPPGSGAVCATSPAPSADALSAWGPPSTPPPIFPQIINPAGTLACGDDRLMFSFLDASNVPVAAPDRTVQVALFDLGADPGTPNSTVDGTFIWAIEDAVGVYVAPVAFPTAGTWGAEFQTEQPGSPPATVRMTFEVQPTSTTVSVGDRAPSTDTPTLDDVGGDVAKISTDDQPVTAFYTTSVADALAAQKPFVLVFATPKFCASQQCGPTLDRIKPIAAAHPDLTFINVEPYQLEPVDGQLQPVLTDGQLTTVPAANDWRLAAEPWVFVVDKDGVVTGSFMLIFGDEELEAAIAAVE